MTPLVKLFGKFFLMKNKNKKKELGCRTLWYLRMCFKGQKITGELLPHSNII